MLARYEMFFQVPFFAKFLLFRVRYLICTKGLKIGNYAASDPFWIAKSMKFWDFFLIFWMHSYVAHPSIFLDDKYMMCQLSF